MNDLYSYDSTYQVTGVTYGSGRVVGYQYDPLGNLTQKVDNGTADNYTANSLNQYTYINSQALSYDAKGNLLQRPGWTYTWDAENRLIRTDSLGPETIRNSTFAILNSKVRQDWSHLPDGRWSQRVIYSWTDNDWLPQATNRFLWDGQVLLAVLNGSNQPEQTYLRGLDLSGTPQGAGGVGGLLAVSNLKSPISNFPQSHFVCFDGNGNVVGLVSADTGTETARYEYDPFGNTLRATGPAAESNSLRFSTQFADDVTRRVKYLYRDYDAGVGRWASRDPIEEKGGVSLYANCANDLSGNVDSLGLWIIKRDGKDRADAIAEPHDTIRGLAAIVRLNPDEWKKWLKVVKVYRSLFDLDTPLSMCCRDSFTIPNTAYLDAASYAAGPVGFGLMAYAWTLNSIWTSEKLKVVYTSTWSTSKSSITAHLSSDNIYKFAYIGHGASGQLTGLTDPTGTGTSAGIMAAGSYTPYHIAEMRMIACESNDDASMWKKNVSKAGILQTVKGKLSAFSFIVVSENGE